MILFINYFWICTLFILNFISFFLVCISLGFKIINWSKMSLSKLLNKLVGQVRFLCKPSRAFEKSPWQIMNQAQSLKVSKAWFDSTYFHPYPHISITWVRLFDIFVYYTIMILEDQENKSLFYLKVSHFLLNSY